MPRDTNKYADRFAQLINDGYLMHNSQLVLTDRGRAQIDWLRNNGYVKYQAVPHLTSQGLRVLMACADRPIPHKPRKIKLAKG